MMAYKWASTHGLPCTKEERSLIIDNGWYNHWVMCNDNPLDDVKTLIIDTEGYLIEIGQKTISINKIQSQYIGLLRFQKDGINSVIHLCKDAKKRSE